MRACLDGLNQMITDLIEGHAKIDAIDNVLFISMSNFIHFPNNVAKINLVGSNCFTLYCFKWKSHSNEITC